MNKLNELLAKKNKNLLSVYFTAGYPNLNDTTKIIEALDKNGVDLIEIGLPFSDPIADGQTIQESSHLALVNGMTTQLMFEQLKALKNTNAVLILMTYLNLVVHYGFENTLKMCKESNISAMILPDLPLEEYERDYKALCEKYDIKIVMLISPESSDERIRAIDNATDSFIYMVSSASVTGTKDDFDENQCAYFKRINDMNLKNKRLIGFGISNKKTMDKANRYSSGVIIGSAFIKALAQEPNNPEKAVRFFLEKLEK
ncbi:MAG: tryptophan synthase subunit alpha [Opitutales bacterium]|nr:tryptophan synthase subunit alpha [Opitutales bacterium]